MNSNIKHKVLAAALTIAAFAVGQTAWAGFTISASSSGDYNSSTSDVTTTFTIRRTDASKSETVHYRTVGKAAFQNKNFTPVNGSLTFDVNETTKTVEVTEPRYTSMERKYFYQSNTRSYIFELMDADGYPITSASHNIGYHSVFTHTDTYVNQSVNNLVYFNSSGTMMSGISSNKYIDVPYAPSTNRWIRVTDAGYGQAVHTVSTNNLYDSRTDLREYLNEIGYKMYATVYFDQKEEADGYQYIQILADNATTYDPDDKDGTVDWPRDYSIYKACFILSYEKSGSVITNPHKQFFPHKNNWHNNAVYRENNVSELEFDDDSCWLYRQEFKSYTDYDSGTGSINLATTINDINIRFDAAGSGSDTWDFRNLKLRLTLVDKNAPTTSSSDIELAPGPYHKGQKIYVSIPFNEIVSASGTVKLETSWGDLTYNTGNGTNVLTFSGDINPDTDNSTDFKTIRFSGSGTIKDLAGNAYTLGYLQKTFYWTRIERFTLTDENTVISGLSTEPYIDDGVNHPQPIVTWRGKVLTLGTDYKLYWSNNGTLSSGTKTATVTIEGQGDYTGSVSATYTIRALTLDDFTQLEDGSYEIANKHDLGRLNVLVGTYNNECLNLTFRQTADISINDTYYCIGDGGHKFRGTYDGQGYTISDARLDYNGCEYIGLFGHVGRDGVIKNLVLDNFTVYGGQYTGGICGYCKDGTIINCRVGTNVSVRSMSLSIGGVVGRLEGGKVIGCASGATVTASSIRQWQIGGIVGYVEMTYDSYNPEIRDNLYFGTSVTASGDQNWYVGAILGRGGRLYNNYHTCASLGGLGNGDDNIGTDYVDVSNGYDASYGRAITLGDGVSIDATTTVYDVSGLTAYGNVALATQDGTIYSAGTKTIPIKYSGGSESFTMPDMDVIVLTNGYSNSGVIANNKGAGKNVVLSGRTLYKDNSWNTLCLPFDVTIDDSPLAGATVMELDTDESSLTASTLTLNFTPATVIEAGKPYLIKWESDDSQGATDVNISNLVFSGIEIKQGLTPASVGNAITFSGTYAPVTFEANDRSILYVGASNQLYYPSANVTMNAFRAYFQVAESNSIKQFVVDFGDDNPTAIETIANGQQTTEGAIYNIAGQRLNKPQKGVNIVNGKKIAIK